MLVVATVCKKVFSRLSKGETSCFLTRVETGKRSDLLFYVAEEGPTNSGCTLILTPYLERQSN